MKNDDSHSTVEKALQVLLALSDEDGEIGTCELGRKLDIHKATMSRILIKLSEYGFVYKNKETRKYWLGPAIHQLAMTMSDINFKQVLQVARPQVDDLRDTIDETVALEVWLGNSTVPTYSALSRQPLKITPPPGEPLALHAAAGAKALLSCMHTDRVDMLLRGELSQFTQNTITDKAALKAMLVEYNRQGYAIDSEEFHTGICAIAAPIFDKIRQPIAAIVILVPAVRYAQIIDSHLIQKLKRKTDQISKNLASSAYLKSS